MDVDSGELFLDPLKVDSSVHKAATLAAEGRQVAGCRAIGREVRHAARWRSRQAAAEAIDLANATWAAVRIATRLKEPPQLSSQDQERLCIAKPLQPLL